jgi:ElaB/YqjD/DUF883 family membrane-anchored ribosome-binding protein
MADQIRVENDRRDIAPRGDLAHDDRTVVETETLIPAHPDRAAIPVDDPEVARAEIENTRARMSETIDEIEGVLTRKKAQIQDRLDVLAPVRENPLKIAGAVFAAGLILGWLTGGDDDDERPIEVKIEPEMLAGFATLHGDYDDDEVERAEMWETRARRLLRIAREQEQELEAMRRGTRGGWAGRTSEVDFDDDDLDEYDGERGSTLDSIGATVTGMLTNFLRDVLLGRR